MIARWRGRIPAGVTTAAFATTMDLFATLAGLAGAALPTDRSIDGVDLAPVLLEQQPGREPLMFYYFVDDLWAVRRGPWKLHLKTTDPASVTTWGQWVIEPHDPPLLYNVETDPGEKYDQAKNHPRIVAALIDLIERQRAEVGKGQPQR